MRAAVAVTGTGDVGQGWGRAQRVAIGETEARRIASWQEIDVGWDQLHDAGSEGSHHARIARFLTDNQIEIVVSGHMGPPMLQMLDRMGIRAVVGATGPAREAALGAVSAS